MHILVRFNDGEILFGTYYGKSDYLSPWIFTSEEIMDKKGKGFSDKEIYECCEEKDAKYIEEHKNVMIYYPGEKDEVIDDIEDEFQRKVIDNRKRRWRSIFLVGQIESERQEI